MKIVKSKFSISATMLLYRLTFLTSVFSLVLALPFPAEEKELSGNNTELEAARNARYYFASDVEDQINDLTQHRDETRDGLNVRGSFSYSDGFLRRQVTYVADENGYRIIRDDTEPLPGPKVNPEGTASVRTIVNGSENNYKVMSVPVTNER